MPTLINLELSDFGGLSELTAGQVDAAADFVPVFDASANVAGKAKPNNLGIGEVAGVIKMFGGSTAPNGYLLCDGSAASRSTHAALFAVIGTTYGAGDGSTTFNVPDFRGRVPAGVNHSGLPNGANGSYTTRSAADSTGTETHTLTENEMPSHSHSYTYRHAPQYAQGGGSEQFMAAASATTGSAGGGGAHNNM